MATAGGQNGPAPVKTADQAEPVTEEASPPLSSMTRYTVRVNGLVYEALVEDPMAPVCVVCGHALCPCYVEAGLVSCDTVLRYEDGEPDFCDCDCSRGVDANAVAVLRAEVRRRRQLACFGGDGCMFTFQEPPIVGEQAGE